MSHAKINAALYLVIGLPVFAVVASVGTAVVAVTRGDAPLPGQYHWEGDKLDHDFAQSRRAEDLRLNATVDLQPQHGVCHLSLFLDAVTLPPAVDLALIHGANPALDRTIRFSRVSSSSSYSAPCTALPDARWHVELSDPQGSWSYRAALTGQAKKITLSSTSLADDAT
jgi:hypothetical protein